MLAWDTYLSIVAMEVSCLRWRINVMLIKKNKNKKREKENVVDIYIYIYKWFKNSYLVKHLDDERQPAKLTNLTKRKIQLGS